MCIPPLFWRLAKCQPTGCHKSLLVFGQLGQDPISGDSKDSKDVRNKTTHCQTTPPTSDSPSKSLGQAPELLALVADEPQSLAQATVAHRFFGSWRPLFVVVLTENQEENHQLFAGLLKKEYPYGHGSKPGSPSEHPIQSNH